MNAQDLLFDFYRDSFPRNLGINFKKNEVEQYSSIENYLNTCSNNERTRVIIALTNYCHHHSPIVKTKQLIEYLKASNKRPRNILDFGCGNGATIGLLLNRFNSIEIALGIDTDPDIKLIEELGKQRQKVDLHADRSILKDNLFDLILVMHTFHHISEDQQELILQELVKALQPGGVLYLVEDSLSVEYDLYSANGLFDKLFIELDYTEKLALLYANEYWSNKWCYGKKWVNEKLFYRSIENWRQLITDNGLMLRQSSIKGFDANRLHGVPSLTIIAER